ncbi:MAG: hypothetical protein ACJAT4_001125 [Granulosicoccus sp.]|jgi:hypothetical protein
MIYKYRFFPKKKEKKLTKNHLLNCSQGTAFLKSGAKIYFFVRMDEFLEKKYKKLLVKLICLPILRVIDNVI